MIYTVTFNPSLDYIVSVDDFRLGMTNRTSSELILPGGKGLNVSMVLGNLGIDNTALGFVAGFTGAEIARRVEEMGVKSDFLSIGGGISRINLKLKSIDGTEINGCGPEIDQAAVERLMEKLDIPTLEGMLEKGYPADTASFGKSVTDFTWYYATIIPQESVEFFYVGAKVELAFMGSGEQTVPGKVVQLRAGEDGRALAVIQSTSITADTVSHRTANVKISFRNYKGLRISQKALRILDGEKGVYVKSGYSVKFKKVDILYTGLDYYLCQIQYGSSDQLSLFDEVIVEGTDLYDGKPIDP